MPADFVTLTADHILSLAPDASSAKAGSQLASAAKWGNLGRNDGAIWGECQGSGKDPYRTQIDLSEPAFKCSCPSRKFPCKHGLGLYLLLAAQAPLFAAGAAPQWVSDWLDSRQKRVEKKSEPRELEASAEQAETLAAQAAKREAKREAKVARGIEELQTWLQDLAREGFGALPGRGLAYWDTMAARLVDQQAPALAARLRRAGALCYQGKADWQASLARELAAIYLVTCAAQRTLAAPLLHDVRAAIGWTVNRDDILQQPPVDDRWQVLAQHFRDEERVRARITWLHGARTRRWALLIDYAVGVTGFDQPLACASQFDAVLCFYPGAHPLRALVKERTAAPSAMGALPDAPALDDALEAYADALAANPFIERYALQVDGVRACAEEHGMLLCADGRTLALHPDFAAHRQLLAATGGHPCGVIGEWDGQALLPLSVWADGELLNFATDFPA